MKIALINNNDIIKEYYSTINNLILNARQNVKRYVNTEMVELYYEIGFKINELIENYNLEA